MKVAFGIKAHSGWAALVVIGVQNDEVTVVDRRRIELVEHEWAKQPYHAAENLNAKEARELVRRGIDEVRGIAVREMREAINRERDRGNTVVVCSVLTGNPMPDWSVQEILAVHFRMHHAEGVLFREAIVGASKTCKLKVVEIQEKQLRIHAEKTLGTSLDKRIAMLGKSIGPPWGKDQKDAALAALVALAAK